ncbi:DNA mismatch repair protein MutS [Bradyrhizobium sp. ISRA443]|uniref:MutS-related protein n=1 Tax=unclassified Bradyrhizobium TaxID=2631580 RepID=UPI00247A0837|nr:MULTISPECIES: DNA mismatch repair protein MutS [unclassified Bradyrhizobium]WGR91828.1 DNA mismatch repair protein MutS [Bradyrhizobium sp. ISRA435]WGS02194.1 DNA mismatch repair protein MutS [Bradyrhizobium sp. ISRA436]WGS09079.1 DNA mismatch repair protein MutS [Bradyrhizobium sp. ISRA437]WGS15968.1 DNA mismatch repair protein MutS [Bradyrhizobium sp. ISRA443]
MTSRSKAEASPTTRWCDPSRPAGDSPSILFDSAEAVLAEQADAPDVFVDLNLDQVVDAVVGGSTEYNLKPIFQSPQHRLETIRYRHEIFRDLTDAKLFADVQRFARSMRDVRVHTSLSSKLYFRFHKESWFVHAVELYCAAVEKFAEDLASASLTSRGLRSFRDRLYRYLASTEFMSLRDEAKRITAELSQITYSVLIHGGSFTVRNFHGEADYSAEVEATFEKFKQGAVADYLAKYDNAPEDMNHIEAKVLEFVARLNPEPFSRLLDYCVRRIHFVEDWIAVFDREVQFYISYLDMTTKLERAGLQFCLPRVSDKSKNVHCRDGFDVALALKLVAQGKAIVRNDLDLAGGERIIVVSGPNQGGKTTFARMFGQLHYLASLGCPVPAREARLFLADRLFTHFEREEKVENLRGKLEDDLVRIRGILKCATPSSVIILNEIFGSTTVQDELFLSNRIMETITELDLLCVWVTFVDELASYGQRTVSMVSTVVPDQPALRTFKIERRRANGLAYAMAIAEMYGLTHDRIRERIPA